jgi:hypothetical protein
MIPRTFRHFRWGFGVGVGLDGCQMAGVIYGFCYYKFSI